jgi:hypothetical protein
MTITIFAQILQDFKKDLKYERTIKILTPMRISIPPDSKPILQYSGLVKAICL